jgi:hypothetical protein
MTSTRGRLLLVCGAALISAMCSDSSPTGPSATTDPPATTLPATNGSVRVDVVPNPVPFSGQPITDAGGCAGVKNTWFYEQVFTESGGSEVTLKSRIDTFDGFTVNELSGLNIVVPPNGTLTLRSRWCSATDREHTARSSFTGQDAKGNLITVTGPTVRLMKS